MPNATGQVEKPPGAQVGNPSAPEGRRDDSAWRAPSLRQGIAIPSASPKWLPETRSWFNSLKLSGQSAFYEASDWATAVAAARMLDIGLRDHNASMMQVFERLSARLLVTEQDRKRVHIELVTGEQKDKDKEEAGADVLQWQGRLQAVE